MIIFFMEKEHIVVVHYSQKSVRVIPMGTKESETAISIFRSAHENASVLLTGNEVKHEQRVAARQVADVTDFHLVGVAHYPNSTHFFWEEQ